MKVMKPEYLESASKEPMLQVLWQVVDPFLELYQSNSVRTKEISLIQVLHQVIDPLTDLSSSQKMIYIKIEQPIIQILREVIDQFADQFADLSQYRKMIYKKKLSTESHQPMRDNLHNQI